MAVPRAVAKSLRKSATRLAAIPDAAVRDTATAAIEHATAIGGTFGRRRMFAEVVQKRATKNGSTALVWGKPAGGWSIKSYGRGPVTLRRRGALKLPNGYARSVRAAGGDDRWSRVIDATDSDAVRITVDAIERGVM